MLKDGMVGQIRSCRTFRFFGFPGLVWIGRIGRLGQDANGIKAPKKWVGAQETEEAAAAQRAEVPQELWEQVPWRCQTAVRCLRVRGELVKMQKSPNAQGKP